MRKLLDINTDIRAELAKSPRNQIRLDELQRELQDVVLSDTRTAQEIKHNKPTSLRWF